MSLKYTRDIIKYYLCNIKLQTCEFICIDEISMIDRATFDNIINRVKFDNKYRKNNIKLIIVGDLSGYYFNGGEYDLIHQNS